MFNFFLVFSKAMKLADKSFLYFPYVTHEYYEGECEGKKTNNDIEITIVKYLIKILSEFFSLKHKYRSNLQNTVVIYRFHAACYGCLYLVTYGDLQQFLMTVFI